MEIDLLAFIIIYLLNLLLYALYDMSFYSKIRDWFSSDVINYIKLIAVSSIISTSVIGALPPLIPNWLSLMPTASQVDLFDQIISIVSSFIAIFVAILIILHEFLQKNLGNYSKKYLFESKYTILLFMILVLNIITAFTTKLIFNVDWVNQVSLIYYNYFTFGFLIISCIPLLINIFETINIESIIRTEIKNLPSPFGPFESYLEPWPTLKSIIYSSTDKNPNLTIHILDGIYQRLKEYYIPYQYTKHSPEIFFKYFIEIQKITSDASSRVIDDRLSLFYFELLKSNNDPIFKSDCRDAIIDHIAHLISTNNANGFERFLFRFNGYFKFVIEKRNILEEIDYCAKERPEKIVFCKVEDYYAKNIINLHSSIFSASDSNIIFFSSYLHNLKSLVSILSSMNLCEKVINHILFNIFESRLMDFSSIRNAEYTKLWLELLLDPSTINNLKKLKYNRIDNFCNYVGALITDQLKSKNNTFIECHNLIIFIRVILNSEKSNNQKNNNFILKEKHFIYFFKILLSIKNDAIENYTITENKWKYDAILKFADEIEEKSIFIKSNKKDLIINKLKLTNQKFKIHKNYPLLEEEE